MARAKQASIPWPSSKLRVVVYARYVFLEVLEQVMSVAWTRCKGVCEKIVGSFLGSSVRDLICSQNFPGSTFLRVAVHALDAPGFGRVEATSRAAGSGR